MYYYYFFNIFQRGDQLLYLYCSNTVCCLVTCQVVCGIHQLDYTCMYIHSNSYIEGSIGFNVCVHQRLFSQEMNIEVITSVLKQICSIRPAYIVSMDTTYS